VAGSEAAPKARSWDTNRPGREDMQSGAEEFGLLPGEEYGLPRDDARHWVRVYQELIEFCELTLARPEWSVEGAHLNRRLCHYRLRLRHWQQEMARTR
jgi:hypothetical protein